MKTIFSLKQPVRYFLRGTMLALLATALVGCAAVDRPSKKPEFPHSYKQRHPIVLKNAPAQMDVYITGSALDRRQVESLQGYANDYKRYGKDMIMVSVPAGGGEDGLSQRAVKGIQLVMKKSGVPANRLRITSYDASNAIGSPPIRMSFLKLSAEVDSKCGLYPDDLGQQQGGLTMENRDYWNFGCAFQTQFAMQVDDPRDFIRGREETYPDTQNRMKLFEKYRTSGNK